MFRFGFEPEFNSNIFFPKVKKWDSTNKINRNTKRNPKALVRHSMIDRCPRVGQAGGMSNQSGVEMVVIEVEKGLRQPAAGVGGGYN